MKSIKARLLAAITCSSLCIAQFALAGTVYDVAVGPAGSFVFSPANIVIGVGDSIRWTWMTDGHNVVAGVPGSPTGAFFSGKPAGAGNVYEVLFDQAFIDANPIVDDLYDYHCHPHAAFGMVGSVQVIVPVDCPWDLDGSSIVDTSDLLALFAQWGTAGSADFDGSGSVDTYDLLTLFAYWGPCP